MSKEAMKLALEALEETRNALAWFYDSYPQDVTKKGNELLPHVEIVLTTLREALAEQPAQQRAERVEPVAWPCVIAEADFEQNTITLEMKCTNYKVGAGEHWLTTSRPQTREDYQALESALTRLQKRYADLEAKCKAREPLTDEEIEEINVRLAGSRDLARLFARAIESAHGIKGDA